MLNLSGIYKLRGSINVPKAIQNAYIHLRQTQTIVIDDGDDYEEIEEVLGAITFAINIDTMSNGQPKPGKETSIPYVRSSEHFVIAYPNPAKDHVTFEYDLSSIEPQKLQLVITNITGQTVSIINIPNTTKGKAVWQTAHNPSGVYLYKLLNGDRPIDIGRVIIAK